MHETLRRRILRRLETLPETQLYQVVDYIEFLESRYGGELAEETTGLQRLAERLEDGMRKRTLSPATLREAFQLIAAADRVLSSVSEAGREILADLQGPASPVAPTESPPSPQPARAAPPPPVSAHPVDPPGAEPGRGAGQEGSGEETPASG